MDTQTDASSIDQEHTEPEIQDTENVPPPILKTSITENPTRSHSKNKKTKLKIKQRFCCIAKEYFSEYEGLVGSLSILPRVIVYKHRLKPKISYDAVITLKNNSLYPRFIKYSTDCPQEITITVHDNEVHRYIHPDESLDVQISLMPIANKDINHRRHVFIESVHPNIIFEIPIIVLKQDDEPTTTTMIKLPPCVPGHKTHYETIMYNPTKLPFKMKLSSSFEGLSIETHNKNIIPKRDYLAVLFIFHPRRLQVYKGICSVKFGTNQHFILKIEFEPRSIGVHLSTGFLDFGTVKFEREMKRTITVCNEGSSEINMAVQILSPEYIPKEEIMKTKSVSHEVIQSVDAVSFHSAILSCSEQSSLNQILYFNPSAFKHFKINATAYLGPYASEEIVITFQPAYDLEDTFADNTDPPYFLRTKVFFCFTDNRDCILSNSIIISGLISGPEIEIHPKTIDLRKVYIGEEHCAVIKLLNIDGLLNVKVKYVDYIDPKVAGLRITPNHPHLLNPCTRGLFYMSFFAIKPTKFNVILRFKVVNGATYRVYIKGQGIPVQLRTFPQLVEFGTIPIAVPQKRYLLLMNPLSVPITLQVHATDDGEDQPLVLNIRGHNEILPITVRDPIENMQVNHVEFHGSSYEPADIILATDELDKMSMKSVKQSSSTYSLQFQEDIMEPLPEIAHRLLSSLKRQKIFDKSETDKRVIQEAMNHLLEIKYFSNFNKHSNFVFMDWNEVPSDPKEVYCDNEIIYLRPNTGKSITVLIVPNIVGYFHRSLTVRVCPSPIAGGGDSDDSHPLQLIKSDFLCSKVWYEYNCSIPEIEWMNWVNLMNRIIYAGEEYDFDMLFTNLSNVGGFLDFDVVPSEMSFRDGHWKFYIPPDDRVLAKCSVAFCTIGKTKLSGLLKVVGSSRPYPFHIIGNVLPTEVNVNPKFIRRRVNVFEMTKIHIFIDNATPTSTLLTMKLDKDSEDQFLTVKGGRLSPIGQSMYTTLVSMFTDPDLYTNKLVIDLQFNNILEIPINFLVEGVPLYFEPDIRDGFDTGYIYTTTKEKYNLNYSHYCQLVKVINKGRRAYRLGIMRIKCTTRKLKAVEKSTCAAVATTARFDITPKSLYLEPHSHEYLAITASAFEECICNCEFRFEIADQVYPERVYTLRICMQGTFIDCDMRWNRRRVNFDYGRTHPFKEQPYIATSELINIHSIPAENVHLQVTGPFFIKELYEHQYDKQLSLSVQAKEHKQIFIMLNKVPLRDLYSKQVEGRVTVFAYGKAQKTLLLKVNVLVPEIQIMEPEIVLFTRGRRFDTFVEIVNISAMDSEYIWRRQEVTLEYVGLESHPDDIVADVLSEILRMVDYQSEYDSQTDMALYYKNQRCRMLEETEHHNTVLEILDEIINDLDLKHKRYALHLDEYIDVASEESELNDTDNYVEHTIEEILNRLKLESSYDVTPASSEYCFSERSIYFYDKSSTLPAYERVKCRLHIPLVRRSFETRAVFQLDVIGGSSQMLSVTVVNLKHKIKFHRDNIYLGIKPWYEMFHSNIRVTNITKYPLKLTIEEIKLPNMDKRLVSGYAKVVSESNFDLEPLGIHQIKHDGLLGFSESFQRIFKVGINRSSEEFMRLRGQGVMPILSMSTNLPMIELEESDISQEYCTLLKIYKFEMFKAITELDEEPAPKRNEEGSKGENMNEDNDEMYEISESEEEMSSERREEHDLKMYKIMHSYVLVNNNEELPNAIVLKQLIETEKYLRKLKENTELYNKHQLVYQNFIKLEKTYDKMMPVNMKHYAVQSLPFELHGNVLDLGKLKPNITKHFQFVVHFFGPGKLIAAARTAVKIPGLLIDFKVQKHQDKKFLFWSEQCKAPEFFDKKYRNMFERVLDSENNPRLKHAHSFDINLKEQHQREISVKDRRAIENYYNSLNPSVYEDHKHHFTLCKIFTKSNSNFSGVDLHVVGHFKPDAKYYESPQQLIEDYLYIDLHMGPTLPILLRGFLTKS